MESKYRVKGVRVCAHVHACVFYACRLSAQSHPDFLHRVSTRDAVCEQAAFLLGLKSINFSPITYLACYLSSRLVLRKEAVWNSAVHLRASPHPLVYNRAVQTQLRHALPKFLL